MFRHLKKSVALKRSHSHFKTLNLKLTKAIGSSPFLELMYDPWCCRLWNISPSIVAEQMWWWLCYPDFVQWSGALQGNGAVSEFFADTNISKNSWDATRRRHMGLLWWVEAVFARNHSPCILLGQAEPQLAPNDESGIGAAGSMCVRVWLPPNFSQILR